MGEECGIPNIIDTATSPQAATAEGTFAPVPVQPNLWPEGPVKYIKDEYPDAVEHAGIIAIDNPITILNGERLVKTAEHLGFDVRLRREARRWSSPTSPRTSST